MRGMGAHPPPAFLAEQDGPSTGLLLPFPKRGEGTAAEGGGGQVSSPACLYHHFIRGSQPRIAAREAAEGEDA